MSKFEFTGETKKYMGITLHRIRAEKTIVLKCGITVNKGDEGGWIEKESNLCDNAWVFDNASVFNNARVSGDALVLDNARVCDNARVYAKACVSGKAWVCDNAFVSDNAFVCDNALVSGDAQVTGNARVSGDAFISRLDHLMEIGKIGSRYDTTTFFRNKDGIIKVNCGCFYGSIEEFREKVKLTHGENKFAKVYLAAADLAEMQIDVSAIKEELV